MADYLIDRYNAKINAALSAKNDRIAAATQLWNNATADIIAHWQGEVAAATIELTTDLEHRNKLYVEGAPPPAEPEPPPPHEPREPPEVPATAEPAEGGFLTRQAEEDRHEGTDSQ